MFPAQQRFEAGDPVAVERHDRLEGEAHLVPGQRIAHVFLELAAFLGDRMEIARIVAIARAPVALGGIERQIGAPHQLLAVEPIVGRDGDADRCADHAARAIDRIGLRDHRDNLLGNFAQLAAIVDIREDHLELVAAKPADLGPVADDPGQALPHLLEQIVAGLMAQCVVDRLEPVEIDHHQRTAALGRLVGGQRRGEPVAHLVAVGEPRERIVHRHARGIAMTAAVFGDVATVAAVAGEIAFRVELRAPGDGPPANCLAFGPAVGTDRQFDETGVRTDQERQGSLGRTGILAVQFEERREGLAQQFLARFPQLAGNALRYVGQLAIAVSGPEPAQSRSFVFMQQDVHLSGMNSSGGRRPGTVAKRRHCIPQSGKAKRSATHRAGSPRQDRLRAGIFT